MHAPGAVMKVVVALVQRKSHKVHVYAHPELEAGYSSF